MYLYGIINKKLCLFSVFFIFLIHSFVYAYSSDFMVKGSGYGINIKEAKKSALSDLSQQIRVQVDSAITIQKRKSTSSSSKNVFQSIKTRSSLPLIGVVFSDPVKSSGSYFVTARLGTNQKKAYEKALKDTKNLILRHYNESKKGNTSKRVSYLEAILLNLDKFAGYQAVALWMGIDNIPDISISKEDIILKLKEIRKKSDSIDFAAQVIATTLLKSDKVKYKKIYPYPPMPSSSDEVTPFSKAFYNRIITKINRSDSPDNSQINTKGYYSIEEDGIDLVYSAYDNSGDILATGFVKILPKAYKNYSPKPSLEDFSKLIKDGLVVSDKFNVDITTNRGRDHLLYKKGDNVKLFVRMNSPGYFYILVHNLKKEKYSYLLDFYEGQGNEKFIYSVSPAMVNKWIDLGEFEVVPPFGVEKLDVFASTIYPEKSIPQTRYDKKTMLYRLNENPKEAVMKTRGLVRKNRIKKKSENAEAVLTINSFEK